jgi:hypothetical protein
MVSTGAELHRYIPTFLGAFVKLKKATISFIMSLRPHAKDFNKALFLSIPRKSVDTIQVSLNSDMNSGCFT